MDADTKRKVAALKAKIALLEDREPSGAWKRDVEWYDQKSFQDYAEKIPRTAYGMLAGKQLKLLQDQAEKYGLPVEAGEPVNLGMVLRWFHQFLADHGPRITARSQIEEAKEQLELEALQAKVRNLQAEFERKSGSSISAEEMDRVFSWWESEMRKLGERLGKRFGRESQEMFNETLDRMQKNLVEGENQ